MCSKLNDNILDMSDMKVLVYVNFTKQQNFIPVKIESVCG